MPIQKIKKARSKIKKKVESYPLKKDFWEIASEYWLVKNAQILKDQIYSKLEK